MPFVARLATNCNKKHCFLAIFDPHSSIVKSVFDRRLSGVRNKIGFSFDYKKLLTLGMRDNVACFLNKTFGFIVKAGNIIHVLICFFSNCLDYILEWYGFILQTVKWLQQLLLCRVELVELFRLHRHSYGLYFSSSVPSGLLGSGRKQKST